MYPNGQRGITETGVILTYVKRHDHWVKSAKCKAPLYMLGVGFNAFFIDGKKVGYIYKELKDDTEFELCDKPELPSEPLEF